MSRLLIIFIGIALLVAAGIWLAWPRAKATGAVAPAPASPATWPMYRGGSTLSGAVPGLPSAYKLKWSRKVGAKIEASPVISETLVVVADEDGLISALDRVSGKTLWSVDEKGGVEASPLLVGQSVVVATLSGDVISFQLQDGKEQWRFKTKAAIHGAPNSVVVGGRQLILFGDYDFSLYALDAAGGTVVWQVKTENFINGSPAIDAEGKYAAFGGCDGWLRVVELASGQEKAQMQADSYLPSSPSIHAGTAYVGSHAMALYAVELASGKLLWTFNAKDGDPLLAPPATDGQLVLLNCGRNRLIIDARTGKQKLSFPARGASSAGALIGSGKALLVDEAGWITLASLADGKTLWEYEIGPKITATPAIAGRDMVVADTGGTVYCFEKDGTR
jgi:outer membrane protein assembly factor BamB